VISGSLVVLFFSRIHELMAFRRLVLSHKSTVSVRFIARGFTAGNAAPVDLRIHDNVRLHRNIWDSKLIAFILRCVLNVFDFNTSPILQFGCQKATVTLTKAPNVLTLSTLKTLRESIKELELNTEVDALVLTASPGSSIFCAGLDLQKFHKPDPKDLYDYWHEVCHMGYHVICCSL